MFNLSIYLEKFASLKNPRDIVDSIKAIISDEIKIPLPDKSLTFKKGRISFTDSSCIKFSIFTKKEVIIKRIQKELPELGVIDIC